jgi:hypothetical protein
LVFAVMVTKPDRGLVGENGIEIMINVRQQSICGLR